jgi:hypothetical protein
MYKMFKFFIKLSTGKHSSKVRLGVDDGQVAVDSAVIGLLL